MNEAKRREIARILRELAEKIEEGVISGAVHDLNGNHVGRFQTYKGSFRVQFATENAAFCDD